MNDSVHFDGDPATDSARRHMERVLKAPRGGVAWRLWERRVWLLWQGSRAAARTEASGSEPKAGGR